MSTTVAPFDWIPEFECRFGPGAIPIGKAQRRSSEETIPGQFLPALLPFEARVYYPGKVNPPSLQKPASLQTLLEASRFRSVSPEP